MRVKRPAASSGARNLPRHGLTAEGVTSIKLGEENKTGLPTYLKVANPARLVAEGSPARAGAQRSEREKGGDFAPRESRTVGSGAPLVTFPATGKSPGCRTWLCHALAERLHHGEECRGRGAAPPRKGAAGERNVPPQNKPKTSRFIKYDNTFTKRK